LSHYKDDGETYLRMYPHLAKRWINVCVRCHHQGYKPDMVELMCEDQNIAKHHLMSYFEPMAVNDAGLCEYCAKLV